MKLTVEQLAKQLGAELTGDVNNIGSQITAVSPVKAAGESEVTFITDDKHQAALSQSHAGAKDWYTGLFFYPGSLGQWTGDWNTSSILDTCAGHSNGQFSHQDNC